MFHRKESSDSVRALLMEGADPGLKNAKGIQYIDDLKLCIIFMNGIMCVNLPQSMARVT